MPGIGHVVYPLVAVLGWFMVAMKFRHVRRDPGNPSQRALLAVFVFIALTVTSGSPPFWSEINRLSRYGDLATLYAQTFVVCALASLLSLLVLWSYPLELAKPRIYLRLALIGASLAMMIVLFVTVDRSHSQYSTQLARWYGASSGYIAYLLVYHAAVSVTMIDIAQLCSRYARRVNDRHVRAGLRTTAVGSAFVLLYSLIRVTDIISAQAGIALPHLEAVATLCTAIGAALAMLGLTYPSWVAVTASAATRIHHYHAYRQMEPLWTALVQAAPGIVLEPKPDDARALPSPRDFDFKLRRRVIEIHDGELALRPYREDTQVVVSARTAGHGLSRMERAAHIEAICLHAALTAKAENRKGRGSLPDYELVGAGFDDELRWLALLSKTFTQMTPSQGETRARP